MTRPRKTRAVVAGWQEIRALIAGEMEHAHRFACREASPDPDSAPPNPETCRCRGCVAARHAWRAVEWIDARLAEEE